MRFIAVVFAIASAFAYASAAAAVASGRNLPEDEAERFYFTAGMFAFPTVLLIVSLILFLYPKRLQP